MKIQSKNRTFLFLFPIALSIIGLFFIFESSSLKGLKEYSDMFHFFKLQSIWIFLGTAAMIFFSKFDYHKLYYFAFPLMLSTIIFLIVVLIPGIGFSGGGSRSWIDFGILNFQPTEFAKFSVIIYLSSWFLYKERKRFSSFIALLSILVFFLCFNLILEQQLLYFF